jgi:hypothetical protein
MKWITRERIRVNRTANCWLVRRFLDPQGEFIFVPADQVAFMQLEPARRPSMLRAQLTLTRMRRPLLVCRAGA